MIKSKNFILKIFLVVFTIMFISLCAVTLSVCKNNKPVFKITPSVENKIYYTTDKLSDIEILLAKGDTEGKIEWVDQSLYIQKGLYSYAYKFTPKDTKNFKITYGTIPINGYGLTDFTSTEFPAITKTYTGGNCAGICEFEGMEDYIVIISGNYVDVGEYNASLIIKQRIYDDLVFLKDKNNAPTRQLTTKTCKLTIEKLQLNQTMANQVEPLNFTAEAQTPDNVVKNGVNVIDSKNYDIVVTHYKAPDSTEFIEASSAIYPGEYKAIAIGKKNLEGQIEISFEIAKANSYDLTLQSTNENPIYAGATISDVALTKLEGMEEFYWDTTDEDYSKKLVLGENYRKAIIKGGSYFNDCEVMVKIITDVALVDNEEDLKSSIERADVILTGDVVLNDNLTIPKNATLTINPYVTLTVNEGVILTIKSGAKIVNNGRILKGAGYGQVVAQVESVTDLKNDNIYIVTKFVLQNDITPEEVLLVKAEKPIDCVLELNGYDINNGIYLENEQNIAFNFKIINSRGFGGVITNQSKETDYAIKVLCSGNANIYVENVKFISDKDYAFVTKTNTDNAIVEFKSCTFTCTNGTAAYLTAKYEYNFIKCKFVAKTGVYIKAGDVTIKDCNVQANGEKPAIESTDGDCIVIETDINYDNNMNVKVNNTIFTTEHGFTIHETGYVLNCTTTITVDKRTKIGEKSEDGTVSSETKNYYSKNDIITIEQ